MDGILIMVITILVLLMVLLIYNLTKTTEQDRIVIDDLRTKVKELGILTDDEVNKLSIDSSHLKSYTYNKKHINLCLKGKNGYHTPEVLLYVLLHEIAHTKSKTPDHSDEFKAIFKGYIDTAVSKGYISENLYVPKNYCGL